MMRLPGNEKAKLHVKLANQGRCICGQNTSEYYILFQEISGSFLILVNIVVR